MANMLTDNQMMMQMYEPKLKHRYICTITNTNIPSFLIKAVGRPKVSFAEVQIDNMNSKRYVKGKPTWETISMTLDDSYAPSTAQFIMQWVNSHHEFATGRQGYAESYMKDIVIDVVGPLGDKQQKWVLKNAWITNADFGDLDATSQAEKLQINLTIRYDKAILEY